MSEYRPFARIGDPESPGPFLFTCEHASNELPHQQAGEGDRSFLEDHWGWDIGAENVVRALARETKSSGVVSRFSRLIIDPNRPLDSPTLVVRDIQGHELSFNRGVGVNEVAERVERYFEPYHNEVLRLGKERRERGHVFHVVSIHSFTPIYLGTPRAMEIGVLFDDFDEDAWRVSQALEEQGFASALNAPYSGRGPGALIYAANRHGTDLETKYLELEIRQDLIGDEAGASDVAKRIAAALRCFEP